VLGAGKGKSEFTGVKGIEAKANVECRISNVECRRKGKRVLASDRQDIQD